MSPLDNLRDKNGKLPKPYGGRRGGGGRPPIKLAMPASHNTATRLLKDLNEGRMDPLDLTPTQRRACLLVAADGKRPSHELASLFKVSSATIRSDMARLRTEVGAEVMEWDLATVIGDLALAKERCVSMALKDNDAGLVWTIHREFAKALLDAGVVVKRNQQDGFRVTIEAVGGRYEEAVAALSGKLDPLITGEVVAAGYPKSHKPTSPLALPLREIVAEAPRDEELVPRMGVAHEDWPDLEPG